MQNKNNLFKKLSLLALVSSFLFSISFNNIEAYTGNQTNLAGTGQVIGIGVIAALVIIGIIILIIAIARRRKKQ